MANVILKRISIQDNLIATATVRPARGLICPRKYILGDLENHVWLPFIFVHGKYECKLLAWINQDSRKFRASGIFMSTILHPVEALKLEEQHDCNSYPGHLVIDLTVPALTDQIKTR